MATATEITFEPLPIRRRALTPVDANQYSVTGDGSETKQIKANTAYEAFKLSGFKQAIKIERVSNINQSVLTKDKFSDTKQPVPGASLSEEGNASSPSNRRKNIIVSADELDALMHTLREIAERAPEANAAVVPPVTPPIAKEAAVSSPTGIDVHGEGYDEIIPSSPAAKPAALSKPAEVKDMAQVSQTVTAPSAPQVPERELSKDEIDKLLGGK